MPWKIEKQGDRFCVVTDPAGEKVKCHPDKPAALAHLRALYANVPDAKPKAKAVAEWEAAMELATASFVAQHPFGRATVRLEPAGRTFKVAVARTLEERICGMTGRRWQDDDFEAMLFDFGEPTDIGFHMNGVVEQLYIAWFDADGRVVDHIGMFTTDPYTYKAGQPFRWALEMPAAEGLGRDPKTRENLNPGGSPWAWLDGQTLHIEEI